MPKKSTGEKMVEYSISLPAEAVELIESLVPLGFHGGSRGEVTRRLILSRLEQMVVDEFWEKGRSAKERAKS